MDYDTLELIDKARILVNEANDKLRLALKSAAIELDESPMRNCPTAEYDEWRATIKAQASTLEDVSADLFESIVTIEEAA